MILYTLEATKHYMTLILCTRPFTKRNFVAEPCLAKFSLKQIYMVIKLKYMKYINLSAKMHLKRKCWCNIKLQMQSLFHFNLNHLSPP